MRPQLDPYPDRIRDAIDVLLRDGLDAGAIELEPIAYTPREIDGRPRLSVGLRCGVFLRDGFVCRYCGGRTILTQVMELLSGFYPGLFPYHPNWKGGLTHPAIAARSAMVDHVEPVSLGGAPLEIGNLVTACNPCNSNKADFTLEQVGWTVLPIEQTGWVGLTDRYADLWVAAGRPNPSHHRQFMTALGISPG